MTERFHEFFQTSIQNQRTPETEVDFESIAKAHFCTVRHPEEFNSYTYEWTFLANIYYLLANLF